MSDWLAVLIGVVIGVLIYVKVIWPIQLQAFLDELRRKR